MSALRLLLILAALAVAIPPAVALVPASAKAGEGASGLPIPRFVSLASDKVNVRTGPGRRYPISWVYLRRGLPVEVIAEFELWRKIRDIDGDEGWIHKSLLSGRRSATVTGGVRALHESHDSASLPVLLAEPGVQGRLQRCDGAWCELSIAGQSGWLKREHFYGVYGQERVK